MTFIDIHTHTQARIRPNMRLLQEGAIIIGDLVTQPLRRFMVEKLTGERYRIKRNDTVKKVIHPTKPKTITKHQVEWKIEKVN